MAFGNNLRKAGDGISGFLYIGFIGLIFLVIFANVIVDPTVFGSSHTSTLTDTNVNPGTTLSNSSNVSFTTTTVRENYLLTCTLLNLTNTTGGLIGSANYTVDGCAVAINAGGQYAGADYNSSYTYSFNTFDEGQGLVQNLSTGTLTFFGFSNTIFTILAVSLLIVILLGLLKLVQSVQNRGRGGGGFA